MSSTSQSTTSFTSVHADKSGSTCYSGTTLHPSSYTSEYPDSHDIDDTASTDTSEPLDQALRDVGVWTIDAPEPEQYQAADDALPSTPAHIPTEGDGILYNFPKRSQPTLFEDGDEAGYYAVAMADGWTLPSVGGARAEAQQQEGSDGGETVCEASARWI